MDWDRVIDAVVTAFRSRADHFVRVAAGASWEQWANAEVFAALSFAEPPALPPGLWVHPELGKIDLAIVSGSKRPYTPHGAIECKVVFARSNATEQMTVLRAQLCDEARCRVSIADCAGLVFASWNSYWRTDRETFFSNAAEVAWQVFDGSELQPRSAIELTGLRRFRWLADQVDAEVRLIPVLARSTVSSLPAAP
jgi:hypothetical protein